MTHIMDETVRAICRSIREEPQRWIETTHTFIDQKTGIGYWLDIHSDAITQTWNGHSLATVFTHQQGLVIAEAIDEWREAHATQEQRRVMRSVKPKATPCQDDSVWSKLRTAWGKL